MLGPVARLLVPNIISGLMRQGGGKSKIVRFCFKGIKADGMNVKLFETKLASGFIQSGYMQMVGLWKLA
jgi:hypothetical protein